MASIDAERAAIVGSINQAEASFQALSQRAMGPPGQSRVEQFEEIQAINGAGSAIWRGVLSGIIRVPEISDIASSNAACGRHSPDDAHPNDRANFFFKVMQRFVYPTAGQVLPWAEATEAARAAHENGDADASELVTLCHRRELGEYAIGCKMMAEIINTGGAMQPLNESDRKESLAALAAACEAYAAERGGQHELDIFKHVYRLRCFDPAGLPELAAGKWDEFLHATKPYRERPDDAKAIASDIAEWARTEADGLEATLGLDATDTEKVVIDRENKVISWRGKRAEFGKKHLPFAMSDALLSHPDGMVRSDLFNHLWPDSDKTDNALNQCKTTAEELLLPLGIEIETGKTWKLTMS